MASSRLIKQINKNISIITHGLSFLAVRGRFIGPKVLVNSIPKSGTNLLQELVNLLPMMRGCVTRVMSLDDGPEPLVTKLNEFKKGQSVPGHITYHYAVDNAIKKNEIRHLLIIRDFRDVILSNIKYLDNIHIGHPHNVAFKKLHSMDEKIHACMSGLPEVGMASWPEMIRSYRGWLNSEAVCVVRFENLVSQDKEIAEDEIRRIIGFLGVGFEVDVSDIRKRMFNPKGLTFNAPGVGKWKTAFSQQQIEFLNEALGEELIYFGYEMTGFNSNKVSATIACQSELKPKAVTNSKITTIAYYLGQFHPIEENNQFWGDGFTEWHNVAKARPLFPGHVQPVLPGRFGFYDLRYDESIVAQLDYAKEIGIDAFCYWHYWFAGKRVLHRPLDRMIALPDRGVKVMLGWANESWTGIWHGLSNQVILQQTYSREELREHAKLIASYINSDRYLRIGNASPFLIYKPRKIPDAKNYLDELREAVRKNGGGDLYIIGNWGPGFSEQINKPSDFGLDAVVANNVAPYYSSRVAQLANSGGWNISKKIGLGPEIRSYKSTIDTLQAAYLIVDGVTHATVVTGWDNTPRSGRRGLVLTGYNKNSFQEAIIAAKNLENGNATKMLFVKSWNEWAEGNTIEPKFNESWSAGQVLAEALCNRHDH